MAVKNSKKIQNNNIVVIASVVVVSVVVIIAIVGILGKTTNEASQASVDNSDLVIPISEVSETAKYYPYSIDGTDMEIIALKASDGTVRTALNTCQICYDSGRGYYVQEGDTLVCQNCGNRFSADQVEIVKGGCNPVPIMKENKTENEANITISKEFLAQNVELFTNWKTR
ncbi:DUF2318 domain-containing protein [Ruminiclostridium herbifermentans]|uniref:DUF2318 domain-containing protein n=2 Tax=Ruminiclostridium herbifermentans TaxID=2488810 RepID=A0A4U7JLX3_9FIRM|nr:DUF2318 domain-containing protein [Ruminiclostridium herbifermentans]